MFRHKRLQPHSTGTGFPQTQIRRFKGSSWTVRAWCGLLKRFEQGGRFHAKVTPTWYDRLCSIFLWICEWAIALFCIPNMVQRRGNVLMFLLSFVHQTLFFSSRNRSRHRSLFLGVWELLAFFARARKKAYKMLEWPHLAFLKPDSAGTSAVLTLAHRTRWLGECVPTWRGGLRCPATITSIRAKLSQGERDVRDWGMISPFPRLCVGIQLPDIVARYSLKPSLQ